MAQVAPASESRSPDSAPPTPAIPTFRLPLHNSFVKLTRDKKLKVVVIGNSVTHGAPAGSNTTPSFYVALERWLKATFPEATVEVVPRIIFAIGPEVQLFRMEQNVFAEKPDLVLAEFGAANGAWGESGRAVTEPATEGFVRRLRSRLPETDCILQMGIFKTMMDAYGRGETPASVSFLRRVAKHYDCALADSQAVLARRILAGEAWETYMKDFIHPSPAGYQVYSEVLLAEMEREWALFRAANKGLAPVSTVKYRVPADTVHPAPWSSPRFVAATLARETVGFEVAQSGPWQTLRGTTAGAHGVVEVPAGKIVGVYLRSPEKRGNLEIRDGDRWVRLSQKNEPRFTEASDKGTYLQRNFFAAYGLPAMKRVLFRISPEPEVSGQTTVEIVGFFAVEEPA